MLVRQAWAKPFNAWDFKSFKGNYPYSPATQPVSLKSAEVYDSPCAWGISPRSSPHAANNLQNQGDSQMSLWELNHSRAILAELIERHLRHLNTDLFPFLFLNVHMQYSLFMWKNKSSCIKVRCLVLLCLVGFPGNCHGVFTWQLEFRLCLAIFLIRKHQWHPKSSMIITCYQITKN